MSVVKITGDNIKIEKEEPANDKRAEFWRSAMELPSSDIRDDRSYQVKMAIMDLLEGRFTLAAARCADAEMCEK